MRVTATPPNTTVAVISIHASTGLRMQTSVMFTGTPPAGSVDARAQCSLPGLGRLARRLGDTDLRAFLERLAVAHDQPLAEREAALDLDVPVLRVHAERHD